jgi:hypothetical protein
MTPRGRLRFATPHHPDGIRFRRRLANDVDLTTLHRRSRRFQQNLEQRITLAFFGEDLSAHSVSVHGTSGEKKAGRAHYECSSRDDLGILQGKNGVPENNDLDG